jgi:GTP pyrophosphokinase
VFAVADILVELRLDYETIIAAILHDSVEDTVVTLEQIESGFGPAVATLVDGVTKMEVIDGIPMQTSSKARHDWVNAESLRKMLLAMVEDVRVVLIKLADRLHNMRTLYHLPEDKQKRIARETLDIYAPLANRMGIWQVKWELEDLALRYLEPDTYKKIAKLLDEKRIDREKYIKRVIDEINAELKKANISAEVSGRPKHIYSIWKKMKRKGVDFNEIFDVRAVRILVESVADCYAALGVVHTLWAHVPKEFDDYIATPKGNNYQSLHTAVIGPEGRTLEVQIRSRDMHERAELGLASHWRYKEGGKFDPGFEQKIAWLRQLLEWKDEESDAGGFVDRFKAEVFEDRVYVITPKGNVVDLAYGATPLDFAYHIHTEIGNRCRGAKINGNIVPLTYTLKTGEQVEILQSRTGTPSRDWLNPHLGYLKTSRAKAKVRTWFKQLDQEKNIAAGRAVLDKELSRLGLANIGHENIAERLHFDKNDDLYAAIGRGDVSATQIANAAQDVTVALHPDTYFLKNISTTKPSDQRDTVKIHGVGNLMTNMARCCKPVAGDPIVGYITQGRGVTIHRADCKNILRQPHERLIEVSWNTESGAMYLVDIVVSAYDRQGLLRDITGILSDEKVNVIAVNTMTDVRDHMASMKLSIEISGIAQLSRLLARINQLPNVIDVKRST